MAILRLERNLSAISQPAAWVEAMVVSEMKERLSPKKAPPTTRAVMNSSPVPVFAAMPEAMGTSATTFSPDVTVTRAQVVTFLWRANGQPAAWNSGFTDVSADAYYAKAVAWAMENGITTGVGFGVFSPDAACTRAQIVTFLYRYLG